MANVQASALADPPALLADQPCSVPFDNTLRLFTLFPSALPW